MLALQNDLTRRPAENRKHAPLCEAGHALPVHGANIMVANWVVGKDCDPDVFGEALKGCGWTCVVVVMTAAVADGHKIHKFLHRLARRSCLPTPIPGDDACNNVLGEKSVWQVSDRIFVALTRSKVDCAHLRRWTFLGLGEADEEPQSRQFSTLLMTLDTSRQTMRGAERKQRPTRLTTSS